MCSGSGSSLPWVRSGAIVPRIRSIKPEFFTDEEISDLPPITRLAFIGLWCHADKAGRLEDRVKRLKALILPYDNVNMDKILSELAAEKFILRYRANGKRLIQVRSFEKHQKPHHTEKESELPGLSGAELDNGEITVTAPTGEGKGEGNGTCSVTPPDWEIWLRTELLPEYPSHRRVQIPTAERELKRMRPDEEKRAQILAALRAWKASPTWAEEDGRFVPGIGKFLKDEWFKRTPRERAYTPA